MAVVVGCGERPPSIQASGSALGANVSASSSSMEATSSSNQEMGLTQPDLNRGDCFTGASSAGNLTRTQDRNVAASEERQPPSSVTLSGHLQPTMQSNSRRRFGSPEIQAINSRLYLAVYVSNLKRFIRQQARDFYSWMRLNPTLSHESYREEDPHNFYARKYVDWTRDYHQQPRPVSRRSGNTLKIQHRRLPRTTCWPPWLPFGLQKLVKAGNMTQNKGLLGFRRDACISLPVTKQ
jgi:hypothetical protein